MELALAIGKPDLTKRVSHLPTVDALKGIGHACGHNLIAMSGCAAAIGVAAALKELDIPGKVLLLGTPAEESGGGKVELLKLGAYKDMAACLMWVCWTVRSVVCSGPQM